MENNMNDNISISVPNNPELLRLAGEFLTDCASVAPESMVDSELIESSVKPATAELINELSEGREWVHDSNTFPNDGEEMSDHIQDADGRPWDERIDSSGKTFMARGNDLSGAGCWKPKNKPKELNNERWVAFHASVKAELMGGPSASSALLEAETQAPAPIAETQAPAPVAETQVPAAIDADSLRTRFVVLCGQPNVGSTGAMKVLSDAGISGGVPNIVNHPDKFQMLHDTLVMYGV